MVRVRLGLFVLLVVTSAFGCGSSDPYCGEFVDITGRAVAYCPGPRDVPVCDFEGERAHYEESPMTGLELVGGAEATCNAEFEIVCPSGTVGEAYCITDPEL